ncbi:hypothetical protein BKA67DRAFT_530078 [Truncatella angustata]|uniref:Uncharacterized protein n=1 Tax=Truncatella angustata TaxID=152316 RepID=A0A9P9A304_9PEZI|nr:uncharacterized protein BKA67DRAFT_530078 [Truncatella angustata]KAH6659957.1 hypothetical protein BKA67DRAFT_530078 [Truncatella angustata]
MTLKPQPAKQHGADGGPNSSSTPAKRKPTKPQGSAKERAGLLYRVHRHFSDLPQLDYTRPTPNYDLAVKLFGGLATDKKAAKTDGKRKAKAGDFKIKRSEIESGTDEDEDEDDEDDKDEVDPRFFERPSSRLGFHRMTAIEEDETSSSRTVEYFRSAKPNDCVIIDIEKRLFRAARPRVSVYAPAGEEHLRKIGSWLGLPEPHSPLNVLKKASRLEWAMFETLPDVTRTGVRGFGNSIEPVRPSSQADIDRRITIAHWNSLNWDEVLEANKYRLNDMKFRELEDSIMALDGRLSPATAPTKYISERTSPTPKERFQDGKRRRSGLMFSLNTDQFDDQPLLPPPPDYTEWTKEVMGTPHKKRLPKIRSRDKENRNHWITRDLIYQKGITALVFVREFQDRRIQDLVDTLSKEKGETFCVDSHAHHVDTTVTKHQYFVARLYNAALQRVSLLDGKH